MLLQHASPAQLSRAPQGTTTTTTPPHTCSRYSSNTSTTAACPYISAKSRAVLPTPGSAAAGSACT